MFARPQTPQFCMTELPLGVKVSRQQTNKLRVQSVDIVFCDVANKKTLERTMANEKASYREKLKGGIQVYDALGQLWMKRNFNLFSLID